MLAGSSHDFIADPRNENILIFINGELLPRPEAKISVFDSGFLLGDGVWEGLRLHNGQLVFGDRHLERLFAGAKAIHIDPGLSQSELRQAVLDTVAANGMQSGVHIRVILSRGLKVTPYQHPRANVGGPTLVIIPEHKALARSSLTHCLNLFTVHVRRGAPDIQDPRWNSLSKLNDIVACIQADQAGADEALMLDPHGFVSTCNSTNFFIVRDGAVWTSTGRYCLQGITRQAVIELCAAHDMPVAEKDFSLVDVYSADEAFVTGTFGGVLPVGRVDGRIIGLGSRGPLTELLQTRYADLIESICPSPPG